MNKKLLKTTENKYGQVRYFIYGNDYNLCTDNVPFKIIAFGKYNIELGSCSLDVKFKTHSKEKPATYQIKMEHFNSNKVCSYDEFICNVFDCVENFIQDREMRYCKIVGNFGYSKQIAKALAEKGYEINQGQVEKSIFVPNYRTTEERANTYKIFNEDNENQL